MLILKAITIRLECDNNKLGKLENETEKNLKFGKVAVNL